MPEPKIITNHHFRRIEYFDNDDENDTDFDDNFSKDETRAFVWFKGERLFLDEFNYAGGTTPDVFKGWDASAHDSFFSGTLIAFSEDCEYIKVGTFIS